MSITTKFWIFAFTVAAVYLVAIRFLLWPRLEAAGKRLLAILTAAQAVTFVLNAYIWIANTSQFWRWFLNIDKELSLGTLLNACQKVYSGRDAVGERLAAGPGAAALVA